MTKVRELMTHKVITVRRETPFKDVVEKLLRHDVSGLPVVDEHNRVLGIVTEADLVSKEAYGTRRRPMQMLVDRLTGDARWTHKAAGLTAESLMTPRPFTIGPDDEATFAARRMLEHGVKRLPVVDTDNWLLGMLSRHDLLKVFDRLDWVMAVDLRDRLSSARYAPADHEVTSTVDRGVVTLQGTVRYPSDLPVIEALARNVAGVVAVESNIVAREPEPTLP